MKILICSQCNKAICKNQNGIYCNNLYFSLSITFISTPPEIATIHSSLAIHLPDCNLLSFIMELKHGIVFRLKLAKKTTISLK